jgi:YARHG domain
LHFKRGLKQHRWASACAKFAPSRRLFSRGDILGHQRGCCIVGQLFRRSAVRYDFLSARTLAPSETQRAILSSLGEAETPSIKSKATTTGSATEPKAPTTLFGRMMPPETNSTDIKMAIDPGDRTTTDGRSARDQSSPFNALALHRNVDPILNAEDTQFSNEQGTEFSEASHMAAARPLSTRAASTSLVTGVPVDRAGFIFDESDVRYLSRAELEKLSPEQLRIARHEILARKGRFFKDPTLSVHFRKFSWYQPSVWRVRLNAIEQANVSLIWSIETSSDHSHGPRG